MLGERQLLRSVAMLKPRSSPAQHTFNSLSTSLPASDLGPFSQALARQPEKAHRGLSQLMSVLCSQTPQWYHLRAKPKTSRSSAMVFMVFSDPPSIPHHSSYLLPHVRTRLQPNQPPCPSAHVHQTHVHSLRALHWLPLHLDVISPKICLVHPIAPISHLALFKSCIFNEA